KSCRKIVPAEVRHRRVECDAALVHLASVGGLECSGRSPSDLEHLEYVFVIAEVQSQGHFEVRRLKHFVVLRLIALTRPAVREVRGERSLDLPYEIQMGAAKRSMRGHQDLVRVHSPPATTTAPHRKEDPAPYT